MTGGATDEVRDVLGHHGLADRFVDILGSPTPKSEILGGLAERGLLDDAVFVGDSRLDMEVSARTVCGGSSSPTGASSSTGRASSTPTPTSRSSTICPTCTGW